MVNHFRTLLLNRSGRYAPRTSKPYDVYIPQFNSTKIEESHINYILYSLFKDCLTEVDEDRRVFQLLKIVDASELAYKITELDKRITYDLRVETQETTPLDFKVVLDSLKSVSESAVASILNEELAKRYTQTNSFVDKLTCILVSLVDSLEEIR